MPMPDHPPWYYTARHVFEPKKVDDDVGARLAYFVSNWCEGCGKDWKNLTHERYQEQIV